VCSAIIGIVDNLGNILSYAILAYPVLSGTYDDLSPSDLSVLISQVSIYSVVLALC